MWRLLAGFLTVCTLACSMVPETGTLSSMSSKVYAGMDEEGSVVANLVRGSMFTILGEETDADGDRWLHIRTIFGREGYILEADVSREPGKAGDGADAAEGGLIKTSGNANVRETASLDAAVMGQIPAGTLLEPLEVYTNENGEIWYRIGYGELQGYISETAVTSVDGEGRETGTGEAESGGTGQEAGNGEDGIGSDGLSEGNPEEEDLPEEGSQGNGTETPDAGQPEPGGGNREEESSRPVAGENVDVSNKTEEKESGQSSEQGNMTPAAGQEDKGEDSGAGVIAPDTTDRKRNIPMDGMAALLLAGIWISILAIVYIIIKIRRELRGMPIKRHRKIGMGKDREIDAAGQNGQEPREGEGVPQNRKPGRGGSD